MSFFTLKDDCIILNIKVVPNSSKNEFIRNDDILRLKITAPPVDNKANKFVIEYLSKTLKVSKSSIQIVRGDTSREKLISIHVFDIDKLNFIKDFFSAL